MKGRKRLITAISNCLDGVDWETLSKHNGKKNRGKTLEDSSLESEDSRVYGVNSDALVETLKEELQNQFEDMIFIISSIKKSLISQSKSFMDDMLIQSKNGIVDIKGDIKSYIEELQTSKSEADKFKNDLDRAINHISTLKGTLKEMEESNQQLEKERDDLKLNVENLHSETHDLQSEVKATIAEKQNIMRTLQKDIKSGDTKLKKSTSENTKLKKKVENLNNEIQRLNQEIHTLKEEAEAMKDEMDVNVLEMEKNLKMRVEREKNAEMTAQRKLFNDKIRKLKQEQRKQVEILEDKHFTIQQEFSELKLSYNEVDESLKAKNQVVIKLEKELQNLKNETDSTINVQAEKDAAIRLSQAAKESWKKLDIEKDLLKEKLSEFESLKEMHNEEIRIHDEKIKSDRASLEYEVSLLNQSRQTLDEDKKKMDEEHKTRKRCVHTIQIEFKKKTDQLQKRIKELEQIISNKKID